MQMHASAFHFMRIKSSVKTAVFNQNVEEMLPLFEMKIPDAKCY